jgi:hypothetical protein
MSRVKQEGMREEGRSGAAAPAQEVGGRYLTPWELKTQARTDDERRIRPVRNVRLLLE